MFKDAAIRYLKRRLHGRLIVPQNARCEKARRHRLWENVQPLIGVALPATTG